MKVMTVTARYERKLNTGDYSNVTLTAEATVALDKDDDEETVLAYAFHICREQVKEAAAPFMKKHVADEFNQEETMQ